MKKIYPVNKDVSLKQNIKDILPMMFDDFMQMSMIVLTYPMRKNDLHQMRISGKPLRYTMELGEYCFGAEFKKCLGEIKDMLELMGEIHDADVMIPEINLHIKEIRLFNSTITDVKTRLSTKILRDSVEQQRSLRREMYSVLTVKLREWKRAGFKQRLVSAMR